MEKTKIPNIFEVLGPLRWFSIHQEIKQMIPAKGVVTALLAKHKIEEGKYSEALSMLTILWYSNLPKHNDGFWQMSFAAHRYFDKYHLEETCDWELDTIDPTTVADDSQADQIIYNLLYRISKEE